MGTEAPGHRGAWRGLGTEGPGHRGAWAWRGLGIEAPGHGGACQLVPCSCREAQEEEAPPGRRQERRSFRVQVPKALGPSLVQINWSLEDRRSWFIRPHIEPDDCPRRFLCRNSNSGGFRGPFLSSSQAEEEGPRLEAQPTHLDVQAPPSGMASPTL